MKRTTEQQILALFVQAMRTALAILDEKPAKAAPKHAAIALGIFPAQSKYNPFRAYAWNGEKSVYLGMFPSIRAAKLAQREYRAGHQPTAGTRVANRRAALTLAA